LSRRISSEAALAFSWYRRWRRDSFDAKAVLSLDALKNIPRHFRHLRLGGVLYNDRSTAQLHCLGARDAIIESARKDYRHQVGTVPAGGAAKEGIHGCETALPADGPKDLIP
jgi:hypothetical protein